MDTAACFCSTLNMKILPYLYCETREKVSRNRLPAAAPVCGICLLYAAKFLLCCLFPEVKVGLMPDIC